VEFAIVRGDAGGVPVIDIGPLLSRGTGADQVATAIGRACRENGFFYVVGHDVAEDLQARLEHLSRRFFGQELSKKLAIRMERGGSAWRGYFPVGGELTLGRPDQKEGLYFGAELHDDHPSVLAGVPLHGRNLFPQDIPGFKETVLEYMEAMTRLGHSLMEGISMSLGLEASYFADRYTAAPLILFRIFNYPPLPASAAEDALWSVGEHTDYGLLTMLLQDDAGGLQVKTTAGWVDAGPLPGSFVCNIGDMLDRMTGGRYRSTPHRVRNASGRSRLSFPFFFDPGFDAEVKAIDPRAAWVEDREQRWDKASVHTFQGTYGEYLLGKVSRVFPDLGSKVL
jgi:isopenicillin N synthase-like dioxygenase